MIKAFNLAEQYRVPVFFMMDEVVGHMTERVVIPPADQIEVVERRWTTKKPGEYKALRGRTAAWCRRWSRPATATASTSPA